MSDLISVVVPIYNVEKWLVGCINNLINQPFTNIELILVNDGSTDKCSNICDEYAQKDDRIIVINKENGGLSSARNAGIEAATGKYIVFIDPDDRISNDYFLKLHTIAMETGSDAVICGYQTVPSNNTITPNFHLNRVMDGKDFVLSSPNIHSDNDLCFVWRYFYKLSVIKDKNLKYNEQVFIGEDVIFNLEFLLNSERVYAIPDILYFYTVNNPNSLMRSKYKPKLENSLILQYQVRKNLSQSYGLLNSKSYRKDMAYYYINNIFRLIKDNLKHGDMVESDSSLRRVINYEMISNSVKEIGLFYKCENLNEYVYYLALKLKIYPILFKEFKKVIN